MNPQQTNTLARLITEKYIAAAPDKAAQTLAALATHEGILLLTGLKAQSLIAVLNRMDSAKAAAILRRLPFKQAQYVLTHLEVPQAAKLWKEFATPYQERLKSALPQAFVELLTEAGGFAPDSVGYAMQTDFVSVSTEEKVSDLVARLKNLPRPKLPLTCFVQGKNGELKGIIRTVELAFFNPSSLCGSVMEKPTHVLRPQDTLQTAQKMFAAGHVQLLPVVNEEKILIGVLAPQGVVTSSKKTLWQKLKGK